MSGVDPASLKSYSVHHISGPLKMYQGEHEVAPLKLMMEYEVDEEGVIADRTDMMKSALDDYNKLVLHINKKEWIE